MDHARFKANHTAALYVSGDLDERTQESFELHLLTCVKCVGDVEIWRAMRTGLRHDRSAAANDAVSNPGHSGAWRIAASLVAIAIGSGAAGWYGRSFAPVSLADDAVAVFNLPPVTRGYGDCEQLPIGPQTELIALRVPNATTGWRLELTDERGVPVSARTYSVRVQQDGSWLLRMRAKPLNGQLLRLQKLAEAGAAEPLGCLVIPGKPVS